MKSILLQSILIALCVIHCCKLKSQINQGKFFDPETHHFGGSIDTYLQGNNCIYYGGTAFEKKGLVRAIKKLDPNGNLIWTTSDKDTTNYDFKGYSSFFSNLIEIDSALYGYSITNRQFIAPFKFSSIWKIDKNNGDIIWRVNIDSTVGHTITPLVQYDSTTILVSAVYEYNGTSSNVRVLFIDLATGQTKRVINIGSNLSRSYFALAVDNERNIYYSKADTIVKRSANNLDNVEWSVVLNSGNRILESYDHFYIDDRDSLFVSAKLPNVNKGAIAAVSKGDGSKLWQVDSQIRDVRLKSFIEKDDKFYIAWRHIYVGGGDKFFNASCIDKLSGSLFWESTFDFGYGSEAATAIAVDSMNDVFLTGYYMDANYGPGNWGIVKLDGSNGLPLYSKRISKDPLLDDTRSQGLGVAIFKNQPVFIGELQSKDASPSIISNSTFVRLDNQYGNVLSQMDIDGGYRYPSKIVDLKKTPSGILVLKQLGTKLRIEKYDQNQALQWDREIEKDFYLRAGDIYISKAEEVAISAQTHTFSKHKPYFSKPNITDSCYIFQFDKNGSLMNEFSFESKRYLFESIGFSNPSNGSFYFYYTEHFDLKTRKITPTALSAEITTNLFTTYNITDEAMIENDSSIFFFGRSSGSNTSIMELDKDSSTVNQFHEFRNMNEIYWAKETDTGNFLIYGKDDNNTTRHLILFDPFSKTKLWDRRIYLNNTHLKSIMDPNIPNVYVAEQSGYNLLIRSLSTTTGDENWNYTIGVDQIDNSIAFNMILQASTLFITAFDNDSLESGNGSRLFVSAIRTDGNFYRRIDQETGPVEDAELILEGFDSRSFFLGGQIENSEGERNGFIYQIDTALLNPISIRELFYQNDRLTIAPNPSRDLLNIYLANKKGNAELFIYDLEGKLQIKRNVLLDGQISISTDLPPAIYLVSILFEDGSMQTSKWVKLE